MDPQAAWNNLLEATVAECGESIEDAATALLAWLDRGGFPPQTIPGVTMSPRWNRAVAYSACLAALADQLCREY